MQPFVHESTSPKRPGAWGSRGAALAALGFNVAVLMALAVATLAIDVLPASATEAIVDGSAKLVRLSSLGMWLGALGFLPWLKAAYVRARVVASTPDLEDAWRNGPVVSFFIPFLNFVRPYRAVRALNEALDPERVPAPAWRVAEPREHAGSYRELAARAMPERRRVKSAPVALWWGLWIGRMVSGSAVSFSHTQSNLFIALHDLVMCAAALAACVVVWRIDARLEEVVRRKAASVDELA